MKLILLVFALIQFSCVEPRYVVVPSCQCRVNYISPAPQVHRVEPCQNPVLPRPDDGCSHRATAVPYKEVHTSRTLYSKAHPQHGPEFHDEISYQRNYYPGSFEEDLEIESIIYGDDDEDHEMRHRRSVLSEEEHYHVHGDDYRKYLEDGQDEESEVVEDEDEYGELELNSGVDSSDEAGEAISDIFTQSRKQKGDLELGNVISESDVKSIDKEKFKVAVSEKEHKTAVMEQGSDGIPSGNDEKSKIGKKVRRSINDHQFNYQYRPSNQGYCSVLDRYSKTDDHTHSNRQPNAHADDCTISKNLFFGCDMELEDENMKETQRKARKVPKTLTQKINELKVKNEKLKNKAKLSKSLNSKSKKVNKLDKLENSLKKDGPLRNKRKDKEERFQRELDVQNTCPCGFDRNGVCSCQMQPYYSPQPTPIYYENPRGPMAYPVRRVYRQYTPPMPFHGYYRH